MGRIVKRLSALTVARLSKPGMHPDGDGLYLLIGKAGGKSWVLRFRHGGKRHDMGLGKFPLVSLADAREKAADAHRKLLAGENPLHQRRQLKATTITFKDATTQFLATNEAGWKNEKHRWQWRQTLETFAFPVIGELPVAAVDTEHVRAILDPIWLSKTETASRLRGRIEKVLDWSKVRGFRQGDNPARWKGHLDSLLPRPSKVQKARHQPALPYDQVPAFMAALRRRDGVTARALELHILCANRPGEVRGATWAEFDLEKAVWVIPAERMKAGEEHRIPLSGPALAILQAMPRTDGLVFAGARGGMLSDMAMTMLMRRMHEDGAGFVDPKQDAAIAVPHGFRSTFRDWAAEHGYDFEMAEKAIAHKVGSEVQRAYQRSDLFERRRALMAEWAEYCSAVK